MKVTKLFLLILSLIALFLLVSGGTTPRTVAQTVAQAVPQRPFPQHVAYASGTIKPNHRTQAQLDQDVRQFYEHWKASYLKQAGTTADGHPLYRVSFGSTNPGRTVSEGMGYGMIIVAHMAGYDPDAQTIFDGLWLFTRKYPSEIDPRLMGWQVPVVPGQTSSAFDGDADIAYGLLLADAQWGSSGNINYRAEAQTVITAILESTIGPQSRLPELGDWVQTNGNPWNQYTPRSSDFMPAHFRAYGRATGNAVWQTVADRSQAVISSLQDNYSPNTGLLPDFIVNTNNTPQPAPANFLEGANDGYYNYNAGRDPWRIGTDALLNGDAVSAAQARKMSLWIEGAASGNPANIKAGYRLNGQPLADYFTTFFAAPFGVAAMTNPSQQAWLNSIYSAVYNRHEDYYEDSVTLLCLLVLSGNYWDPTAGNDPPGHELYLSYISTPGKGKIGNLRYGDEDILHYDRASAAWGLAFDGSAAGLPGKADVNAFAFVDNTIYLSFDKPTAVPGLGAVDDSDIVAYNRNTGAFTLWFDGSAAGLSAKGENIDALTFDAGGALLISTTGNFNAGGLKGKDEDLFRWDGSQWSLAFDGSAAGLPKAADIAGAWYDPEENEYFLNVGKFKLPGAKGDAADILRCKPQNHNPTTGCTYQFFWDGQTAGFAKLDGFQID